MTDDRPGGPCALWLTETYGPAVELFDTEDEAAEAAAFYRLGGSEHVIGVRGVQFPDGRTVPLGAWEAFPAAMEARLAEMDRQRAELAANPVRVKTVTCPFTGRPSVVDADTPDWAGRP